MSLTLASERCIVLEMARHSARLVLVAERAYFARTCHAGCSLSPRDIGRAMAARDFVLAFRASLKDDTRSLRALGLAGAGADIAREVTLRARLDRLDHCRTLGLDPELADLVAPAREGPWDVEES